jgi:hypothetical protein
VLVTAEDAGYGVDLVAVTQSRGERCPFCFFGMRAFTGCRNIDTARGTGSVVYLYTPLYS